MPSYSGSSRWQWWRRQSRSARGRCTFVAGAQLDVSRMKVLPSYLYESTARLLLVGVCCPSAVTLQPHVSGMSIFALSAVMRWGAWLDYLWPSTPCAPGEAIDYGTAIIFDTLKTLPTRFKTTTLYCTHQRGGTCQVSRTPGHS